MSILDKIRDFNWLRFNDIGKEVSKLAETVKGIATDARKLGKDASAEAIADIIMRVKALKDGTTIDELLGQLLGQAESIFDEHADERAKLLAIGQKQSADLDAPQDPQRPPDPPPLPTGILTSDPGMQRFPLNVWRTESLPHRYLIHNPTIGGPVPSLFWPALDGVEEPNWKIFHEPPRP